MLKLQPKLKVKETQRIIVSKTNYSKEEINSLFELGRFTPVLFYKSKAKRLFDLGLTFEDSKYLIQTKKLNVDEVVKCISDLKLDVNLIRDLTCSKDVLLNDIPNIISMVGGVECLRILTAKKLSIENIKTLFQQLKLNYNDTISLTNCGYKVHEIETLIKGKISCSELIDLARAIEASEVYSLYKENKQNLVFLLSVRNICKKKIEDLDSAIACYKTLYDTIFHSFCPKHGSKK